MKQEDFKKELKASIERTIKNNSTNMKMQKSLVITLTKRRLSPSIPVDMIKRDLRVEQLNNEEILALTEGLLDYFK